MLRARLSILAGNILHHYETSLFGWLTPFLAPVLFPGKSDSEAMLLTFLFLPLSYISKPLGAVFWGWLGDRYGRKPVLITCLVGMSFATLMIGCLPLTAGAWKILTACRLAQGFFSAGEEKGAALYLLEHTPERQRNWVSAFYDATGILGIFCASLLASYFGQKHWRLLFAGATLSELLAAFLRRYIPESPEFKPTQGSWRILWQEKAVIVKIALVSGFSYANYFILTVFLNGFIPQITTLTKQDVLFFNTHLLWIDFLLLLGFGALCRFIRKELLMLSGCIGAAVCIIPLFCLLEGASWGIVTAIRLLLVGFGTALAAPYHAWKIEILPRHHRLLVGSFASTLGSKVLGVPIPALAGWVVSQTGMIWTAALPVVMTAVGAATILLQSLFAPQPVVIDKNHS